MSVRAKFRCTQKTTTTEMGGYGVGPKPVELWPAPRP